MVSQVLPITQDGSRVTRQSEQTLAYVERSLVLGMVRHKLTSPLCPFLCDAEQVSWLFPVPMTSPVKSV